MTINHIDTLAEWYAQAESGPVNVGDTVIYRHAGQWIVDVSTVPYDNPDNRDIRVLARAPKPAWHDARAIIAHTDENPRPSVWTWHKSMERWDDEGGCHWAYTEDLRDVTPLIEAKVTDEMVERAWAAVSEWPANTRSVVAEALAAALGLETE